jgi:hypothetical protein
MQLRNQTFEEGNRLILPALKGLAVPALGS